MLSHTARLFTDGPLRRVLERAAAVRESGGALSLDTELRRFIRTTRTTTATEWTCPLVTVTALLDHVAILCAENAKGVPQDFWQLVEQADAGGDASAYLHFLAQRLRALEQDRQDDYDDLPLSRWEIEVRFPLLTGFGVNWVFDSEHATLQDSTQAAIDSEHPYCGASLAPLAAEAQSALVLFPTEPTMRDNLTPAVGWASPQALRHLLHAVDDHMRQEHADGQ
ncbi:MAG: hypothetical protein H5T76_20050 [Streptomyces sp.]|nr:hypothetical protein [Streptomyces sp.]